MKEPLTMEQRELVREHYKYAEHLADRRVRSCLPPEDRRQEAYIGLMDAARRFDPARHLKFETYAAKRIVGAIIDAERAPGSQLVKATRICRAKGEKQPTVIFASGYFTGRAPTGDSDHPHEVMLPIAPEPAITLDDIDAIEAALRGLSNIEWYVARRYLRGEATLRQIGNELAMSESRVCQMIPIIIERLRNHSALSHYAKGA